MFIWLCSYLLYLQFEQIRHWCKLKILRKNIKKKNLIQNGILETRTFIDPIKQLKHEEREKEWEYEL